MRYFKEFSQMFAKNGRKISYIDQSQINFEVNTFYLSNLISQKPFFQYFHYELKV